MQNFKKQLYSNISIHTLVKRVTGFYESCGLDEDDFNSHSRKESDNYIDDYFNDNTNFNSHSRKESDIATIKNIVICFLFQFTLS